MTTTSDAEDSSVTTLGPRRKQPLEREYRSKRINNDLWLTSDRFERTWLTANHSHLGRWSGSHYVPKSSDPGLPFGAEIGAGAMFEDRFVAGRLGPLYRTMVDLAVRDCDLAHVVAETYPGQSQDRRDLTKRGRERALIALRLCETAHAEFDDMKDGIKPRLWYALGEASPFATPRQLEAANDNHRSIGNAVRTAGLRRWRTNESAIEARLAAG